MLYVMLYLHISSSIDIFTYLFFNLCDQQSTDFWSYQVFFPLRSNHALLYLELSLDGQSAGQVHPFKIQNKLSMATKLLMATLSREYLYPVEQNRVS